MIEITKEYFKVRKELWYKGFKWKDKEGIVKPITHLKSSHLTHILRCFSGKSTNYRFEGVIYGIHKNTWIQAITEELERRKSS